SILFGSARPPRAKPITTSQSQTYTLLACWFCLLINHVMFCNRSKAQAVCLLETKELVSNYLQLRFRECLRS
ncbi:hypothetical protein CH063_00562, partial [Colletotrichum higginsianum]